MKYDHVQIDAFAHVLPDRVVTSLELEERLAPLYDRLRLRAGRLELMSGIRERRHFEPGTRPSSIAARAGQAALEQSGIDRSRIGLLVHASVCRDFMEPATASVVHRHLELPDDCEVFDLSNACLGVANAMILAADRIELGRLDAALVVAGEDGGPLVEQTIASLLASPSAGKAELKAAFASLTIGSGGAAVVLSRTPEGAAPRRRLAGAVVRSATQHHELCRGDRTDGGEGPLMDTDSEALMHAGNALAAETFERFRTELELDRRPLDRYVTHQVGVRHRQLLLETMRLDPALDFPTVERLGNIGSVSLPLSFSQAEEAGELVAGQRVGMLGIGSGLHCAMLAVDLGA